MSSDSDVDRISSLPKNVIEAILMCLPIRDAVRTSILSSGWRYEWSTLPELIFRRECFECPECQTQTEFERKFVKVVDQVLLLHRGPIHTFKLSVDVESCADMDRWILFLSRNGIKNFTLDIWKGQVYKLPSCLLSCADLNYLELYRCNFSPPPSFKGFSKLTVMDIQGINFTEYGLRILMSQCPSLRKLVLMNIVGYTRVKLCARVLEDLSIEGEFEDLHFKSTPLLAVVSIKLLNIVRDQLVTSGTSCRIVKVLGHLPSIERLELLEHTLQNLAVDDVPVCLPVICPVKHLTVDINFEDIQQMLAAFCIFRSSLVLQKLYIKAFSVDNKSAASADGFWEGSGEGFSCTFSHLQVVEVTGFTGITSEVKLIEFVLANAPVLERLQIKFKENVGNMVNMFRELIRFRRISPKAEIFVPA